MCDAAAGPGDEHRARSDGTAAGALRASESRRGKDCGKCKRRPANVALRHALFCRDCFIAGVRHKFHASVQRVRPQLSQAPDEGARVLLAFSGGPASRLLLHAFRALQGDAAEKLGRQAPRLFSGAVVAHVDESVAFCEGAEKRAATADAARRVAELSGFEFVGCSLEAAYDIDAAPGEPRLLSVSSNAAGSAIQSSFVPADSTNSTEQLMSALKVLKGSGREALVRQLRIRLLASIARRERCQVVMFGNSMTRLAVRALSLTSEGRGYVMPQETAVVNKDVGDLGCEGFLNSADQCTSGALTFLRPLSDLLAKEIGIYNWYLGLDRSLVHTRLLIPRSQVKGSIERLTEDFIVGLDKGFPATVSTVARTVAKVTTRASSDRQHWRCPICFSATQPGTADWVRRITVSLPPGDAASSVTSDSAASKPLLASAPTLVRHSPDPIDAFICYGCRSCLSESLLSPRLRRDPGRTQAEQEATLLLPPYMARSVKELSRRSACAVSEMSNEERTEELRKKVERYIL
ncbi:MAG: hypothetical protein BJ554DRAFT_3949 [Olpidium bornovanus]|uniref:Cytoplasmic tRNA 2-thiolation protein 2 n=1 Tax=Olpidium bornovanus TaxID=278681 RepID=A0A8H8A0I8_9FUNG|nr:MAG: hypothetical protein BJ554DRAFT_3949 [Olpidium bornovanus]